jgi:hypothetical protein
MPAPPALYSSYLYKYLFKGPDHARFTVHSLEQEGDGDWLRDEYRDFVNGRYLFVQRGYLPVFQLQLCLEKSQCGVSPHVHLEGRNLGRMRPFSSRHW